jgi:hypothetical protein
MDVQDVFEKMKSYYQNTNQIMQGNIFVKEIVTKHDTQDVIDGMMLFNQFLDNQREGRIHSERIS